MPSYACKHSTCIAILPRPGWCPKHEHLAPADRRDSQQRYDREKRDPEAKRFYDSAGWAIARKQKLADCPWCEICRKAWAVDVHHRKPLAECDGDEKTDQANLQSACKRCHTLLENRRRREKRAAQQHTQCTN